MKLVFMGTPSFAVPCLTALAKAHEVLLVVTQPDKPQGRGLTLASSPVKIQALDLGLPILQPASVKEPAFIETLRGLKADLGVVVAFGQFLSPELLSLPQHGWINVHGSILPQYRGAAPIERALMSGDRETGLTLQRIVPKMDAGDILLIEKEKIAESDTAGSLRERLSLRAPELLIRGLDLIGRGAAVWTPQQEGAATRAPLLTSADQPIDWTRSAVLIGCQIRALTPKPGAVTVCGQDPLKIWDAQPFEEAVTGAVPGAIVQVIPDSGWDVATGRGVLRVHEVQGSNAKRMSASAYGNGHGVKAGMVLGTRDEKSRDQSGSK